MLAEAAVIKASRRYVCVRIESYESEANQQLIRAHLGGAFANTAFCLLAPDGKTRLIRSGRSISRAFGRNRSVAFGLNRIANRYANNKGHTEALTPDFHSFRQALNVAAADQRALVLVAASEEKLPAIEKRMRKVAWSEGVIGRFHFDLEQQPKVWQSRLSGLNDCQNGILIIKPDKFGAKGKVLRRCSLTATDAVLLKALEEANQELVKTTPKRVYEDHVAEGREKGFFFEMAMPYGEDRDGDGQVDRQFKFRYGRLRRWAERSGNLIPLKPLDK